MQISLLSFVPRAPQSYAVFFFSISHFQLVCKTIFSLPNNDPSTPFFHHKIIINTKKSEINEGNGDH